MNSPRPFTKDEAQAFLEALVRAPSVSTQEGPAVQRFLEHARAHGFTTSTDAAGNAVASFGQGSEVLLLLGHIDTVPGEVPVRIEDGKLYGRGSVDAKGPLACFLVAASRVLPDLPEATRIVVVGAVEEEVASSKGAHQALSEIEAETVIVGEPSGWDALTLGYKGRARLQVMVQRAMAHRAGKEETAGDLGFRWMAGLRQWVDDWNQGRRIFESLDARVVEAQLEVGDFEDRFRIGLDLRLPLDFDPVEFRAQLEALDERFGTESELLGEVPAIKSPKRGSLVRAFLKGIRSQGGKARFKVKTGTADMNLVPRYRPGAQVVTYGPGDSSLDHTPNEHIHLEEFHRGTLVLEASLRSLLGIQTDPASD